MKKNTKSDRIKELEDENRALRAAASPDLAAAMGAMVREISDRDKRIRELEEANTKLMKEFAGAVGEREEFERSTFMEMAAMSDQLKIARAAANLPKTMEGMAVELVKARIAYYDCHRKQTTAN